MSPSDSDLTRGNRARVSGINELDSASRSSEMLWLTLPRTAAIRRPTTPESMISITAPIANHVATDIMNTVSAFPDSG